MSTYLLDTSVVIDVLRGVSGRAGLLRGLADDGHLLACTAITVAEVFAGMRSKERLQTVALLDSLVHFDITRPDAELAGGLRREWSSRGRTLALADLLIAAIAIRQELILMTDNIKDFPMSEIRLFRFNERHT